eukprot:180957_1
MSYATSRNKHSHIDTTYNYSNSIIKRANTPLMSTSAPSQFKYCPILSTMHLMFEPYCQRCFGMKTKEEKQYFLHIFEPHNYACPNQKCSLTFVEQKHLTKHIQICEATSLLLQSKTIRQQQCNKNMINFPKQINNTDENEKENIWISCYPNKTYCAVQLTHDLHGSNPAYIDPKHNPPIPIQQCYFQIQTAENKVLPTLISKSNDNKDIITTSIDNNIDSNNGTDVNVYCVCERRLIKTN